ncbi:putative TetR-family transcriptional regulator [Streptomyces avermitilis MA-4680 = NBRC 14893]|uniref:TetR-family transcriptional regulator n=1 Tax=Streptomyces avermitilis (strain ATCC 31267 / DSM 46492 / JCM 5070 / NBRC 14893 / NCIMB 12804 / NRRL 8165 / MA-4680) TaxID=227882 RepID=Q82JE1_STRAW|nr:MULTISPECIES: TetR/AcrR family transcriptional regulator [Streptomyces]MYS98414.1 TetR family transcriptional regulator [Streptomyces sp. SID5469]BAC70525.1 putative TetR-family transcriptional regulator [Streptomyces avermitilis MA-4680 = NBRC 14893]
MADMTTGNTSRADANRRRILDVALAELLRDPDASMDQIARVAGVVRRTVYGHFPSREALISTLVDGAVEAVAAAHAAGRESVADPAESLARSTLAVWEIADRYRILVALAQRSVTVQGIRDRLTPVRQACVELLRRGLEQGVFESPLPAAALAYVHEQMLFALMEAVNDGLLAAEEAGRSAAVTMLTAAGVPASRATGLVAKLSD